MALTKKQEIFAQEYVKCDNKSQAYRIAYDTSGMKDETIHKRANELSHKGEVAGRIKELKEIAADVAEKHFRIDSKELLGHLNILRSSRIDEYVDFVEIETPFFVLDEKTGEKKMKVKIERILQFKPFDQLTERQLMCIESIKDTRNGIELKLHGKDWTIEKIAKHIGFYEKDNKQKQSNIKDYSKLSDQELKKLAELEQKAS